jgi:hypothetical protein
MPDGDRTRAPQGQRRKARHTEVPQRLQAGQQRHKVGGRDHGKKPSPFPLRIDRVPSAGDHQAGCERDCQAEVV